MVTAVPPTLSYCVVNTNGRDDLLACLEAIERTHPEGVKGEILVLDNASEDGSAEAVRRWERERSEGESPRRRAAGELRLIALDRRAGKAENDSTLLREAGGEHCLLLNEDSELRPRAPPARGCSTPAASRCPAPGASPASARRWSGRSSCTAASPCRARERRRARSTGRSRAPCWCGAERRRRSATSTQPSSSTTTSATSAGGSTKPAGAPSSCPPPRRSTTTSSRPTSPPACRESP